MKIKRNLWPTILVAVGALALLQVLSDNKATPGLILVVVGASLLGMTLLARIVRPRHVNRATHISIAHKGAERARLRVHGLPGALQVLSGAPPVDLLSGHCPGGTSYSRGTDGDIHTIDLTPARQSIGSWITQSGRTPPTWTLRLNETIVYGLSLRLNKAWANLDLLHLFVSKADLHLDRCNLSIRLPQASGLTRVRIKGNNAKVQVRVPPGVGAQISVRRTKAAIQINRSRFPQQGRVYESEDWSEAPNRVEIALDVAAGQVEIN